ncbi:MAG: acyl-[acyl-carrier-protein] thioesterase [Eubacteriales bacterium]
MIYTVSRSVDIYHTDWQQHLTAANLGRYMHECAYDSLYAYGPNPDELLESGYAFILSRISYRVNFPVLAKSKIEVSTWPVEGRGLATGRFYSVRSDGRVAAEASSSWAFMNLAEKRPTRVSDSGITFDATDYERTIDEPLRFRLPKDMELMGIHKVSYTDVDLYRHMNNAAYISLIENHLPCEGDIPLEGRFLSELDINYANEATYGTPLSIYIGRDGGALYFRGEKGDGSLCFDARVVLDNIK